MKNPSMLKSILLRSIFLLGTAAAFDSHAQTPQSPLDCKVGCTSNDVQILRAYLVNPTTLERLSGNFSCSGTVNVKLALELTTNTPRVGVVIYANVRKLIGTTLSDTLVTKKECFSTTLNQPTNRVVFSEAFGWPCGLPIALTDVFLGWGTGNTDFCQNKPAFRCPGTPSKCYSLPPGQYIAIEIPTAQNISRSRCPDTVGVNRGTFNLTALNGDVSNNSTNTTVSWYSNAALTTRIGTPGAFTTVSTTVYAKVANNADTTIYSTATVTLTVLDGPVLAISNPSAVCAPGTVDITAAAVTAGSTLPTGTTLSYWTNSGATTSLSAPGAVSTGTYYIKAATNSNPACLDIKAVTVTVNARPTLSITNPAALCAPATADLTAAAVTTGSTLPTGTTLSYWTDAQASTPLGTPAAAGNGTYYIKAASSTTPPCSDIQSVVVTVRAAPVLSITNPAAVCSPATVNLTAAAVTAGSTLPSGTTLSYWTNAAATTSLSAPGAAANGTYYIKAATTTTPACSDIEAVTVTVNTTPNAPALCAVLPDLCSRATGSLTVTSPTGSYQYSIDGGQHWQTSATFSNLAPASNPSILVKGGSGCISSATSCSDATTCAPTARSMAAPAPEEKKALPAVAPTDDGLSVKVFPNPFRNTVTFTFTAPVSGKVSLEVYDNAGRQLGAISYGEVSRGTMRTLRYTPRQKLSALLLYRLRIGSKTVSGKMIQSE